tara:strand:+ start:118 stop:657 length:540 start_codon:yes stop_codon:yes gene_type:complete
LYEFISYFIYLTKLRSISHGERGDGEGSGNSGDEALGSISDGGKVSFAVSPLEPSVPFGFGENFSWLRVLAFSINVAPVKARGTPVGSSIFSIFLAVGLLGIPGGARGTVVRSIPFLLEEVSWEAIVSEAVARVIGLGRGADIPVGGCFHFHFIMRCAGSGEHKGNSGEFHLYLLIKSL